MRECRLDISPSAAVALALGYYLDNSGWFAASIPAILCHELGHWIAIRLLGGRVTSLRFELGGLCMESTAFPDRGSELAALAAGPALGLFWGAAVGELGGAWAEKSRLVALALNFYNLLPALPLDGGRMLLLFTGSAKLLRWSGLATASALLLTAVLSGQWLLFFPAAFLVTYAVKT